jgi:hypothetical protein
MATVTASYNWVSGETVTPTKLNTTAAPTVVVADNEVTTAKILDANVTNAKLATGIDASKLTTGTLPADRIGSSAITTARINDAAVTAAKLDGAQTGSAPIFGARAWVNFDGTTVTNVGGENRCTIRGSGNITKVVRNNTGFYTIHLTTALPDTNYAVFVTTWNSNSGMFINGSSVHTSPPETGQFVVRTSFGTTSLTSDSTAGDTNAPHIFVAVFR